MLGGSQVVRGVLQLGRNFGAELLAQKIERDIRDELYVSLLGKSMTFHNLQPVGDTMARATNDVREVNFMFSPGFNLVAGSLMFLIMPLTFPFLPTYFQCFLPIGTSCILRWYLPPLFLQLLISSFCPITLEPFHLSRMKYAAHSGR